MRKSKYTQKFKDSTIKFCINNSYRSFYLKIFNLNSKLKAL
jgi:hypothetical protein